MKKIFSGVACVTCMLLYAGCIKDTCTNTYKIYIPVYKSLTQVRAGMKSLAPQAIEQTGKIYMYGKYIFLNELNKGIHVIDNSDPAAPVNRSFIPIPGNIDLAVKGNYLFADSYSDLVVFDISNSTDIRTVKFLNNIFPFSNYYGVNAANPDSVQIVVDYIEKDTTINCEAYNVWLYSNCAACEMSDGARFYVTNSSTKGIGGSMARFAVMNNYLYTVSNSDLSSFNIINAATPQLQNTTNLGSWQVETIYPFNSSLFIGSSNGMFIYDVSNPGNPVQLGQFSHVSSCDPVIADNKYAYVTLRSGTTCQGFTNELEVMGITDMLNPALLQTYPMTNPHGLSKDGNWLFVCDGNDGLKIFDATDAQNLQLKQHITGLETYDVITTNNIAIVVASDGLYQFDYSDINNIHQLSKIMIQKS